MCVDFSQANTNAEMITPLITAMARSPVRTVIIVTATMTKLSARGTFRSTLKVGQAKVPITTINISPTSAASGIFINNPEPKTIKRSKKTAALIPESLPLPLLEILIILCPIIAHPPIHQKNQQTIFASHCPIDSWLAFHLVWVFSSISVSVIKDSVNPTIAIINA